MALDDFVMKQYAGNTLVRLPRPPQPGALTHPDLFRLPNLAPRKTDG